MNKKAEVGPLGFILLALIGFLMYALWLGKYFGDIGHFASVSSGSTGFDAFMYGHFAIFLFFIMVLGISAYVFRGSA